MSRAGYNAGHQGPGRLIVRSFGRLLRQYRLAAGMTQEVRAERAGLGVRTLPYLERDRWAAPRQDTLDLLVRALTLSPQE